MIAPWWPIITVDVLGSITAFFIAIRCIHLSWGWSNKSPDDVFRHYAFMLTLAIGAFAIFRSFGHLVKQGLLFAGWPETWQMIAPFSGAGNTMTFVTIFAFSIYFDRQRQVKLQIDQSTLALAEANAQKVEAQKSYDRLRSIFDGMEDAVYIVTENYQINFFNRKMQELVPSMELGKSCFAVLKELAEPCEDCNLASILREDKNISREFTFLSSDRKFNLLEIPMRWIDGTRVKLNVARDITFQKELEEQLLHAQKLESIGTLAGGIAHDINNALTPILGYTELALLRAEDNEALTNQLIEIKRCAKRSSEMIRRILAFSKRQILQTRELDINELVKNIAKMFQSLMEENITLKLYLAEDLERVSADQSQIEQIITNLAVNARDAMPEGGTLMIETMNVSTADSICLSCGERFIGPYVLIVVSDSGAGMNEKIKERIFEPYFTTKGNEKGTGLGLAMVHGIIHQHEGHINLYTDEHMGTTVKIFIPTLTEKLSQETEKVIDGTDTESNYGSETILLVEDDESVRKLAVTILRKFGYQVIEADSGEQAIELVSTFNNTIDLILTDVVMPGMNGKQLVGKIQAIFPKIHVLYMSGYTNNLIASHGILEPEIEFIQKPFVPSELTNKIHTILHSN